MNDRKESGPIIPISGIIALLAFIGLSFYSQLPFKGTRPLTTDIQYERYYDKVTARLWQDPFGAVLAHLKKLNASARKDMSDHIETINLAAGTITKKSGKIENNGERNKCLMDITHTRDGPISILGIMVPGGEYAEDEEGRMRQRYAVMSGLRSRQFLPQDSEYIQFALLNKTDGKQQNQTLLLTEILPYEWFSRIGTKEKILVLWLNEKAFQHNPLFRLSCLVKSLGNVRHWKIIGPFESTTLQNMLSDLDNAKANACSEISNLTGLKIYSAFATADASGLLNEYDESDSDNEIVNKFDKKGIDFVRTIGSDKSLADVLVKELGRRRVFGRNKTIILVSESDTLYAGALHHVFRRALSAQEIELMHASYLRGIDGILPGEKDGKADMKGEEGDQKNKAGLDLNTLEKPAGKSQYDYLRRHADKIYHRLEHRHRKVAAIGILGNNFHDKYLALQAFRQRFPQAIYFTTDLDAMWMHPAHLQWTRNLLIASHFDLTIRPERKDRDKDKDKKTDEKRENVPSFRDCYQTSAFAAIQRAFPDDQEEDVLSKMQPALFEIGHTRAINLQRNVEHSYFSLKILTVALCAFIIMAILFFTKKPVNQSIMSVLGNQRQLKNYGSVIGIVLLILIVIPIIFYASILTNTEEEPFTFLDGISVWPSNLLRLLAALLSAYFIFASNRSLKENKMVIDRQLSIKDPKQEERGRPNYIKRVLSYDFFREYTDGGISTLWNEYIIRSQWRYRISWVLGALFVYFIASSLFLGVLGAPPEPPVRGPYSYTITMIILILSGALFSFLFLYVFDATRLCHQFMVNVAEKGHYWPKESLLDFLDEEQPDRREEQKKLLSEWRTVLLVAKRTDAVGRLIFYPLIVGIVVFIARHSYFDNWNTTIPILVILMVGVLVTWICALIQRFDAEHLRNASISRLKEQKMAILYRKDLDDITRQIDHAIEDIKFIKQGAFAPFSQQPVFHSIILALSSIGGTYLIEFVSALNF